MGIENIKIEPMLVTWGEDRAQIEKITVTQAGVSLAGKYFIVQTSANVREAYWMDDGVATAPVITGITPTAISFLTTDSVTVVAAAVATAVGGSANFNAVSSGNVVTVTHVAVGYAAQAHDAYTLPLQTGWAFSIATKGSQALDLGCVLGNIEVSNEIETTDITCHASGSLPVAKLLKSVSNEITIELQETHMANLKKVVTSVGSSYLPSGAAPTEVLGIGTGGFGVNLFNIAEPLTLHPKRLGAADKSGDWRFWKAIGLFDSIAFSGEDVLSIPLTFSVFPDSSEPEQVNILAIGDWSQL